MNKEQIIRDAHEFMETHVPSTRPKEGYLSHVLGVLDFALMLAKEYNADAFILEIAALLHDTGAYVGENHCEESAKIAQEWLAKYELPKPVHDKIIACILHHSTNSNISGKGSIEEQILRDADGLGFLKNNFIEFYDIQKKKHLPSEAKAVSVLKVKDMFAKVTTEKGISLGKPLLEKALEYFKSAS